MRMHTRVHTCTTRTCTFAVTMLQHDAQRERILKQSIFSQSRPSSRSGPGSAGSNASSGAGAKGAGVAGQLSGSLNRQTLNGGPSRGMGGGSSLQQRAAKLARLHGRT